MLLGQVSAMDCLIPPSAETPIIPPHNLRSGSGSATYAVDVPLASGGNWTEVPHALSCASPCRSCSNGTNVIPAQRHDAAGGGAAPASCTPAALAQYPDPGYHQFACAQAGEAANCGRASAHSSHRLGTLHLSSRCRIMCVVSGAETSRDSVVGAEESNILNFDQNILKNKVILVEICRSK